MSLNKTTNRQQHQQQQQQNYCSFDENYQNLSPVSELEESQYYTNELNEIDDNVLHQLEVELIRKQLYEEKQHLQKLQPQLFNDLITKNRRPVTKQKYYNEKMPYYNEQNGYQHHQSMQQPNQVPQSVQELYYNPNIDHCQQHQQILQPQHNHNRKGTKNSTQHQQQQPQLFEAYPIPSANLTSKSSLKTRCNIAVQRTAVGPDQAQQNTNNMIDEYKKTFIQNNKINQRKLNQQSIHKANNNYSMALNEMELANTKLIESGKKDQQAAQQQQQQQQQQHQKTQQSQNYKQSGKTPAVSKKSPIRQSEECGDCGDYCDNYSFDDSKYGDYKYDEYEYNYMKELEKNTYNSAINQLDDEFYNLQTMEKSKLDDIKQTTKLLQNQVQIPPIQSTGDTIVNNCLNVKPRSITLEKLLNSKEKEKQLQQHHHQQLKCEEKAATTTALTSLSQHQKKTIDNDVKINYHNKNFNERPATATATTGIHNLNNIDNDYIYNSIANSLDVVNLEKSKNIVINLIDNELKKLSNDKIITDKNDNLITSNNKTIINSNNNNKKSNDDVVLNERIKRLRNVCFNNILAEVERLQNLEFVTDFTFVKPGSSLSFKTKVQQAKGQSSTSPK